MQTDLAVISMMLVALCGCGYHVAGSATHIPANVRTLTVPLFKNHTQAYHTETAMTQAVIHEMNTRTRYRIVNTDDPSRADAVLRGTVLTQTVAPLTYDPNSGQTSSYLVTITAKVTLTGADGRVLYSNSKFSFRQQYQSTQDLSAFIQEDSAAVRRLSRDFAQALVSDMLESF
ncbi:MAG: hypothetical protein JSS87_09060 [Acidobacteria bacterium]|nr:hypothetical protein [Acidobacteriota bacterium]